MARLLHSIEMLHGTWNGSSGATAYQELTGVSTRIDTTAYDGTVEYYFEACFINWGSTSDTACVELYNHTDGSSVAGSELTTSHNSGLDQRLRSPMLSLSGDRIYTVRIKDTANNSNIGLFAARVVIVQSGHITKTQLHQELGSEAISSSTSSSYVLPGAAQFLYEAAKYDGSIAIRHDAVFEVVSGNATYSCMYDETAGSVVFGSIASSSSAVSEFSHASSGTFALVDGHTYRPTSYIAGGPGVFFESSQLVFTLTDFTKYLSYFSLLTGSASTNSTNYDYNYADYQQHFNTGDLSGCSTIYYFEAFMGISNPAQTASVMLTIVDNQTTYCYNTDAIATKTGSIGNSRIRIGGSTLPAGSLDYGIAIKSSGGGATATCQDAYLVQEVFNIDKTGDLMALFEP